MVGDENERLLLSPEAADIWLSGGFSQYTFSLLEGNGGTGLLFSLLDDVEDLKKNNFFMLNLSIETKPCNLRNTFR